VNELLILTPITAGNFDRTRNALKPVRQATKNTGRTDRLLIFMSFLPKTWHGRPR
jgi:hypothetical protein